MAIRILIADDHAVVRRGILTLLEDADDLEVIGEAADGEQALAMIPDLLPDVLLLDITMPKLSGLDVVKEVVARFPTVRVLMFSMHNNPDYILTSVQHGALGYLPKDSDHDEILKALRTVAAGDLYYPPSAAAVIIRHYVVPKSAQQRETPAPPKDTIAPIWKKLTPRETQILHCLTQGMSSRDIAHRFDVSPNTIANQRASIIRKAGVKNMVELISVALGSRVK
ncbi:response regulator [Fibrella aquatica]|jgi:DNA-binding NarL/FixJ family response regulator|uniref:response regulator n=1 Tax=Fibrella aquatica TaxID=3242487 RepID=UPI003520DBF8